MINLIRNEITKIFKKKGIYITLIVTLLFVLLTNLLCKYAENFINNMNSNTYKTFLESELSNLDPSKVSDNSEYISIKTELDAINLTEKYGSKSWQAAILNDEMYPILSAYNERKYALEKDDQSFKIAEEEFNRYIKLLDSGDWKYFVRENLNKVKEQIKQAEESKKDIVDTVQLAYIDERLYELNLQKQVLDYRLEKNISYDSDRNQILNQYHDEQLNVYKYEHSRSEKKYEDKLQYQYSLEQANIGKYAIDHDIKVSQGNDFKGILEDFFSNYELFIVIIIVMIAGTIVSEEFNKGTIKLLLVKPYSRIKVLLAKFITVLIMILVASVLVLGLQILVGGIIFGFKDLNIPTLVYNFNTNSVVELNTFAYIGIALLHKLPLYILLATIAFAFSTAFTNTPIAIVISLLGYMSTSIINVLVENFKIVFMKFFITQNWDLTQYLFGKLPTFEHVNFSFSVIVCVVYFILMIVPTFIIFRKKNIKNV